MEERHADIVQTVRRSLPYNIPRSHASWEMLSAIVACINIGGTAHKTDQGCALHSHLWRSWYQNRYPLYCLSNELLRQFQQTDTKNLAKLVPADWRPPVPLLLLLLPNNAIVSPKGHYCPYILVAFNHPEIKPVIATEYPRQISIATSDNSEVVWVRGSGLGEHGEIITSRNDLGSSAIQIQESAWLEELFGIALQSSLALTYLSELVEAPPPVANQPRQGSKSIRTPILHPRWIGRYFERRAAQSSSGSDHQRTTHWRRGHWRQQPCGEGRQQHRLLWIRPTLINGARES